MVNNLNVDTNDKNNNLQEQTTQRPDHLSKWEHKTDIDDIIMKFKLGSKFMHHWVLLANDNGVYVFKPERVYNSTCFPHFCQAMKVYMQPPVFCLFFTLPTFYEFHWRRRDILFQSFAVYKIYNYFKPETIPTE